MNHRKLITSLLLVVLFSSCASPAKINRVIPPTSTTTATSIATPSPTSTLNVSLTQVEETRVASLLESYQKNSPSNNLSALTWTLGEPNIKTLWFTQDARWWSSQDEQTAQKILKLGMNPGLGGFMHYMQMELQGKASQLQLLTNQ
jgi:hypothetical protein